MISSATFRPEGSKQRTLYVHIPFCRNRCGYCNFSLLTGRDDLIDRFLDALAIEIGWLEKRQTVETIFLGGGTPSHLNRQQLLRLFEIIDTRFNILEGAEISVECNPNDLDKDLVETFAKCGINRVSLGVQSFQPAKLKFLERTHDAQDIESAVVFGRNLTENISFDLIFGTPGETVEQWLEELGRAEEFAPKHLSTYELTIEKGTDFWNRHSKKQFSVPGDDRRAEIYQATIDFLCSHGFGHYEISSFSKPGYECRHNQSYWDGSDYFAFGPGAARYIDGIRETNHRSTTTYIKRIESGLSPIAEQEEMTKREQAIDRIVFGLRQLAGFDLNQFEMATGCDAIELMGSQGKKMVQNSLLEIVDGRCKMTSSGLMFYDSICELIVHQNDVKLV